MWRKQQPLSPKRRVYKHAWFLQVPVLSGIYRRWHNMYRYYLPIHMPSRNYRLRSFVFLKFRQKPLIFLLQALNFVVLLFYCLRISQNVLFFCFDFASAQTSTSAPWVINVTAVPRVTILTGLTYASVTAATQEMDAPVEVK